MPLSHLLDQLALAELEFACFNAHRTGTSDGACIHRGSTDHFEYVTDTSRPNSAYYNRAVGKAVCAYSPEALEELPATVRAVELRPAEIDPDATSRLHALGFRPSSSLCYLAIAPPTTPLPVKLPVTKLAPSQTDLFFDALESAGTPFSPERRAAKRLHYCTEQFQAFVALDAAGAVIGLSTMFMGLAGGGTAFLGNSYTRPEARGRGVHSALISARINAAASLGVRHIFTDVEHGSQSHANCERVGFRTASVNFIWQRQT